MSKNKTESAIFNYKFLRLILMTSGSLMIALGSMYGYFIISTVGFGGLSDAIKPFLLAVLAVPAGIYICIIGKKLKKPIIKEE
ncbi:MAG: hypothetical protein HOH18_01065 [Kordiimonadaceae bacterium]|jgi:hypothetical protein|nr:hypothetical protein [Kordiimonadaceae bacterium]MBT6035040.1 hypothetical protein [Kordiimonadaceae bacterium]MBT7583586.1 hypothetical protein [Kordiimonadaceae bacterium]